MYVKKKGKKVEEECKKAALMTEKSTKELHKLNKWKKAKKQNKKTHQNLMEVV